MKVNILYFASLRDDTQKSSEKYDTNANSIDQLFNELNDQYNFKINKDDLKVALNEEYVNFDSGLSDNDTIVFIPPVAGG